MKEKFIVLNILILIKWIEIEQLKKKAEADLTKEVAKGASSDKFIKTTYARQIATCNKNRERYLLNKGKVQSLGYTLDTYFCKNW